MKVADTMRSDEALLLPPAYDHFVNKVCQQWTQYFESEQTMSDTEIPGTRWLLVQLHFFFGDLSEVKANIKDTGQLFSIDPQLLWEN